MEDEDVDDYGTDQDKRQGDEAVDQEEDSAGDLDRKNGDRVVGGGQHGDVLHGQRRHGPRRDEMEEAVESEDGEEDAENVARDGGGDFHRELL